ncbi:hypothetical protein, partial [Escherichia coli]|uniref:hypothetical protein n=1 Tax=Escherichia coli TaxID=562 RepID=UPI002E19C0BA|nr:hypothetical protein [Escherichia coli]
EGWAILLRQKQKKLIMLPSETMIWQPEFTDKTLSRKPGAVQWPVLIRKERDRPHVWRPPYGITGPGVNTR